MNLRLEHIPPGGNGDLDACRALRYQVFVLEQRVPEAIEMDDRDASCTHILIRDGEQTVATGRLLPEGRIGRMAVHADYRGSGLGRLTLDGLMACAAALGHTSSSLHAQNEATGFYSRAGFGVCGPTFVEAGILHTPMRRELPPPPADLAQHLQALVAAHR